MKLYCTYSVFLLLLWVLLTTTRTPKVDAFAASVKKSTGSSVAGSLFQERPAARLTVPSKNLPAAEIELPDFVELFRRLQQVSPLAASVLQGKQQQQPPDKRGFAAVDDTCKCFC